MSSRRRLLQGSSRPASRRPQQSRPVDVESSLELPPYQPPRLPLNGEGQRLLKELSSTRIDEKYEKRIGELEKVLRDSVYAINERLTARKKEASDLAERDAKRRRATGDDDEAETDNSVVKRAKNTANKLGDEVAQLTAQVEEAMREVLDMKAALQDKKSVLEELPYLVEDTQRSLTMQARPEQEDDENQEPPEIPGVALLDILQKKLDAKAAEYEKLGMYEKYALDNSYISFKGAWHEGLYLDEVPLPDATTWFDQQGRPQHKTREERKRDRSGDEEEDESDDEIQIAREKMSFRCPISLTNMTQPYTCRICKHSFEKSAIISYIQGLRGGRQRANCPVAGCVVQGIRLDDFFLDESLLRKIKRASEAEREQEEGSQSDEDEDMDASVNAVVKPESQEEEDD